MPKSVVIKHRFYCSGAFDHIRAYNLTSQSRVLQFSSYAFDIGVLEQLSVLMVGSCICVVSDNQRKDNLGEAASALRANHEMLVPSVARLFWHEDLSTSTSRPLAGECVLENGVYYWAQHLRLTNGYGLDSDPQNVGFPVASVAWVVDTQDSNGLTAGVFIQPPAWLCTLRKHSSTRLYKTRDLVRVNADGTLSIFEWKDRQVKVRSQRLELGEVEAYIRQCFLGALEDVAEVVVPAGGNIPQLLNSSGTDDQASHQTDSIGSQLIATPLPDFISKVAAAKSKLRQIVSNFMVPSIFLPRNRIPRTHSDKVDRNYFQSRTCLPLSL
ncbi:hypothetical protein EYZ11_013292 [Aspergillus tanneri]|uniref:AMP-dependent synthetase/ligase domain-containing protein n=1 Tax=Aspergillus tanneri TaxID=1220188 RepID=A0A4S3IY44_9EURO|nr:hypothetical protein EYZ11_013292 [Aspergillus tanneri]